MSPASPKVTGITLHRASHALEVAFDTGETFRLPCEYLRAHSPSAEVQGHGPGQRVLQHGKRNVNIAEISPVGHYGVLLKFDDGHNTGIFSWDVLYDLGSNQEKNFQAYLDALAAANLSR
jgi:DUF971 family protein